MPSRQPNVHVVIVTYGKRLSMIESVLASLLKHDAINRIHIVSNNAAYKIPEHHKIEPLILESNTGSANGYKVGIQQAIAANAEYIWLLDDDNRPKADALPLLLTAFEQLNPNHRACFALVSQRPGHEVSYRNASVPSSFLGFKLSELGTKLVKRLFNKHGTSTRLAARIPVNSCPYGGLFFAPELIQEIGLPNEAFVLYGDDTEFTRRITRQQGEIVLISDSIVEDLEDSFNVADTNQSSLANWLCSDSDMRAFYSARNLAYCEQRSANNSWSFRFNRLAYILMLGAYAIRLGKVSRFQLLLNAFRHAKENKLGFDERFPLV